MQNPQDAPLDGTQTDSQMSTREVEREGEVDLCDTSSPVPQDNTPSAPLPGDESQRNEIIAAAIEFLTNLSTEEAKNHTVHHFIEEAVDYITTFMDELLSTPSISSDYEVCIASLLSTSFVIQLFQLRAVFRGLAAQARPRTSTSITVVSWADDLLVKLCACILHLATNGAMRDFNKRVGTRSIKSLQDNEARKAATQLPGCTHVGSPVKFTELPDALISKYSSPAMARMALTLLYGTTALQQRYKMVAKQKAAQQNTAGLISVVSKCIIKYGASSSSPSSARPLTLVEYAILVSLYTHGTCSDVNNTFAPHTEHNIVGLVDLILDNRPSSPCPPVDNGLGSHSILTEDLSVVEWFWNRWGDGSTLLAATGLKLTRHWIQNYKSGVTNRDQACIEALMSCSPCSFQALLHLVEPLDAGAAVPPPPSLEEMKMVELVCEAYTTLANARQLGDLRYEQILAEACKRLCPYILVSGPDGTARPTSHF
ncbi:hypothetical protein FRC08_017317 [Ceratobasidium sp. 394]|nr:hypothetical protein FRC08_017317 [Ceratobasidium sp. 394]